MALPRCLEHGITAFPKVPDAPHAVRSTRRPHLRPPQHHIDGRRRFSAASVPKKEPREEEPPADEAIDMRPRARMDPYEHALFRNVHRYWTAPRFRRFMFPFVTTDRAQAVPFSIREMHFLVSIFATRLEPTDAPVHMTAEDRRRFDELQVAKCAIGHAVRIAGRDLGDTYRQAMELHGKQYFDPVNRTGTPIDVAIGEDTLVVSVAQLNFFKQLHMHGFLEWIMDPANQESVREAKRAYEHEVSPELQRLCRKYRTRTPKSRVRVVRARRDEPE